MTIENTFLRFPTLITERLRLRQMRIEDAEALYPILTDPQVMRYYGHEPHTSMNETKVLLHRIQSRYLGQEGIRWGITFKGGDDTLIGSCGFHTFGAGYHYAEIGYELKRACWRGGIMTETVSAILDYSFKEMGLHRVEANIDIANTASKMLLLKLGFTFEGNLRQRYLFQDRFEDEYYFGLLRDEWLQRQDE